MTGQRVSGIALALFIFGTAVNISVMADEPIVDECLAASFYPDGDELLRDCSAALLVKSLDEKAKAKINLQLGEALYFARRPGMALPFLNNAINSDGSLAQAFRRRGWSNLMLNRGSEAMSDFTEFLQLRPSDPDAPFALAFARRVLSNDCATTIRDYEQILKQHPDHFITRYNLAGAYQCLDGNPYRQLEQFDLIIAAGRERTSSVTYYSRSGSKDYDFYALIRGNRFNAYFEMNRFDDAVKESAWLIEAYPQHPQGYIKRSMVRLQTDDHLGALEDAEAALNLLPGYPDAQIAKLDALYWLRRNDEIIRFASAILTAGYTSSVTPAIRFKRGTALKRTGHKIEALEDLNVAMAMADHWVWAVHSELQQAGYMFGPTLRYNRDPLPDFRATPFINALDACMLDPGCFK